MRCGISSLVSCYKKLTPLHLLTIQHKVSKKKVVISLTHFLYIVLIRLVFLFFPSDKCADAAQATTGALICGKTKSAITDLYGQFKNRTVEKTYLAVVHGSKEKFAGTSGDIESHLRKARGYVSVVDEPGPGDHLAYTSWELLASSVSPYRLIDFFRNLTACCQTIAPLSLVKLKPKTGFKHQLRAQLAAIGGMFSA